MSQAEVYEFPRQRVDPLPAAPLTEHGYASRLVALFGDRLRYVPVWGTWLAWDGHRWAPDDTGGVARAGKAVADLMIHSSVGDKERLKTALRLDSRAAISGAIALAGTEPGIAVTPRDLDAHPDLLNTRSGVLDLRTGRLTDPDPQMLLTKVTAASYDPEAGAPNFEMFLERIQPDADTRDYLQRHLGAALPGHVAEHLLHLWIGAGRNGKSTLIRAVSNALGDYAATTNPQLLVERGDAHPTGIADLFGVRLAFTHETDERHRLAEGTVKRLTGGDKIKARRMRQDWWEFEPSHTLVLVTNHRPLVRGDDEAIWRRLRLVPFGETIAPDEEDHGLADKLQSEAAGTLRWLVAGHAAWRARGLDQPSAVSAATADYRAGEDDLGRWLDERTVRQSNASAQSSALCADWTSWCAAEGSEPGSAKAFTGRLQARGLDKDKSGGVIVWRGIGLTAARP